MTKEELTAKVAAPAQVVPAPGVEAVSEREFKQFLSDVLTAAGLVTHGNKCKDLGRRLGEMSMRLLTAPKTAAAPVQAGEYPPSSADMVMAALDTEEWGLERMQRWDRLTDEGNREEAWLVKRQKAPYCAVYTDKPGEPYGPRSWSGPTALDALQKAADDLGIRLPQPAAQEKSVDENDSECEAPPIGWRCTRTRGHAGPCAAVVSPEDRAFVERGMRRIRDAVDAERYRCLRSIRHWIIVDGRGHELRDDGLDSAIDDAIAAKKGDAA